MALCEQLIKANIQSDCNNPMFSGYTPIGYIINKDDIEAWNYADDEHMLVDSISLKQGKQAFKIQSIGQQPTPTTQSFVEGNFYNTFENSVQIALLDNSPEITRDIIRPISSGAKFVVILEHERKASTTDGSMGEVLLEIFGLDKGLKVSEMVREEYSADYKGGWNITLKESDAPLPAKYAYGKSIIAEIETPAV